MFPYKTGRILHLPKKQRMTIDLTHRQFELLLQLVYMGRYCYAIVERPETMTAEEGELIHLVNKIYKIASETPGLTHLADDYPDGRMRASIEVENRNEAFLNAALDRMVNEHLANGLASGEIKRTYGELPKEDPDDYAKWSRLYEAAYESMLDDLEKNGLKHIRWQLP